MNGAARLRLALAGCRKRAVGLDDLVAPVVVGCSGGPDSLAALALAVGAGLAPTAVHVDHGLRPGSGGDAELVAESASALGAQFRNVRVEIRLGGNLEARARDARHGALEASRREIGATAVVLGHTADDQAETVLLNLLRGAAAAGLGGMAARAGTLARPLISLRRADTVEICARLGLAPAHDPMNDDLGFRRVWLRREVIPLLERSADRDLVPVLARQADVLRAESELLDEMAGAAWPDARGTDAGQLAALPVVLARRAVRRWVGRPPPSLADVEAVLAVARGERRAVDLAGGRRVARRQGQLRVDAHASDAGPTVVLPGAGSGLGVHIESWVERDAPVRWPDGRWTCVLDGGAGDPVAARLVRTSSDRIALVGADGERLWTVGYGVGPAARVSAATRRFLWISARETRESA
jgi:tRNA(Ile)-lysidine synthase